MNFLKGLVLVLGLACLWGLGVVALMYFITLLPSVVIAGLILFAIGFAYVRLDEKYSRKDD